MLRSHKFFTVGALALSISLFGLGAADGEKDNSSACPGKFKPPGGGLWGVLKDKVFEIQIGDLGITIGFMAQSDFCKVTEVRSSFSSRKGYFKVGDMIKRIGGESTQPWGMSALTWNGEGPRIQFGKLLNERKSFKVRVERNGQELDIACHPDTYVKPYADQLGSCARAFMEQGPLRKYIDDKVKPNGMLGKGKQGIIVSTLNAIGIMNSDDTKKYKICHDMFKFLKDNRDPVDIGSSWELCYYTTFMCEYYLKFKKPEAIDLIKKCITNLENRTTDKGKHGHGTDVGYNGGGINAISAHVYLSFVLAEKCNVLVNREKKAAVKSWIIRCTSKSGAVGYASAGGGDLGYRTPIANIAYRLDGETELAERTANKLLESWNNVMSGHALAQIPLCWSFIALKGMGNKDSYLDRHYKNFHWYFSITKAPDNYETLKRFYVPSSRNDAYFSHTVLTHVVHATIFSMRSSGVLMTGGDKNNKKTGRKESKIDAFAKNMNDNPKTLDYVGNELDKFLTDDQFAFTLKWVKRMKTSSSTKDKASALYNRIYERSEKEFAALKNFALMRPGFSYGRMNFLASADVLGRTALGKEIKSYLKSNGELKSNSKATTPENYFILKTKMEKVMNSKTQGRAKIFSLKSIDKTIVRAIERCPQESFELRHDMNVLRAQIAEYLNDNSEVK